MMKKAVILTTAPVEERPSLWRHRDTLLQIAGVIVVMTLLAAATEGFVRWILVTLELVFVGFRGLQINKALLPPVLGVESLRPTTAKRPLQVTVLDMPSEAEEPPTPAVEKAATVAVEGDSPLYEERAHVLLLLGQLLRAVPAAAGLWIFAAIQSALAAAPDRGTTQGLLVAVVISSGVLLLLSKAKEKQLGWMRKALKVILVGSLVSTASLTWTEALTLSLVALIFGGIYVFARRWAKWYCTKYIVTTNLIAIERKSPWYFFLEDSRPFLPTDKLTSVDAKRSSFEKFLDGFGIKCGTVEVDTPGQKDERFHRMRFIYDPERMANILSAMVVGK